MAKWSTLLLYAHSVSTPVDGISTPIDLGPKEKPNANRKGRMSCRVGSSVQFLRGAVMCQPGNGATGLTDLPVIHYLMEVKVRHSH